MNNSPPSASFSPQPANQPVYSPSPAALTGPQPGYEQQWQAYQAMRARQQAAPTAATPGAIAGPAPVPATPSPIQMATTPIAQASTAYSAPLQPSKRRHKKALLAAASAVVVALAGTYTFAFYLPSRPENVWSAGLGNTGRGLSQLSSTFTSPSSLNKFNTYQFDTSFKATTPGDSNSGTGSMTVGASLDLKANDTASNGTITGTVTTSAQRTSLTAQTIATAPNAGSYPNVYLQVSGLDTLGLDGLLPDLSQYNGKWISIPSSYLQQKLGSPPSQSTQPSLTKHDVAAFTAAVVDVVNRDVLTSSQTQSILQRKSFVGHEAKNGRDSYHYTATVSASRASAFCRDLETAVTGTQLYKKLGGSGSGDSTASDIQSCTDYFNRVFPASKTLDVWIDSQYHLLSAIRFNPDANIVNYTEFGQTFDDLSKPSLYYTNSDNNEDLSVKATFDRASLATTLDITYNGNSSSLSALTVHAGLVPYDGTINVTPPTSSIDIRTISLLPPSDGSSPATDSTNTTDTTDTTNTSDTSVNPSDGAAIDSSGTVDGSGDYVSDPTLQGGG